MFEPVNERCIKAACGQALPLRVVYCPFCGMRQAALAEPAPVQIIKPPPVTVAPVPVPVPAPAPIAAQKPVPPPTPAPQAAKPPPAASKPLKAARSVPPPRPPIRLRTWIVAALALLGIWLYNKPSDQPASVAQQVAAATALAAQCDLDGARSALATLKSAKAPAAQIKQLQSSINSSSAACDKKQRREQDGATALAAVNQAFDAGTWDVAATRLAAYVKRHGDDADTLELDAKIKVAQASGKLDAADACLARSDRVCLESNLIAAERYKRPELAARTQALRTSLSQLLEHSLLDAAPAN
ncbi:hypothetical protein [Janthinobacterium sp.]|uniref:hypothetical protein n=1 Tax=Janthinobacterium sp. TaxID=1871054 RepID=UPI002628FE64|nr:hypothetical protein [Janthinobacterium sp.]